MARTPDLLPARSGETDDETRFREAVNRLTGQMMATLDAAVALRTAPSDVAKARHLARNALLDFALRAQHAHALSASAQDEVRRTGEDRSCIMHER